VELGEKSSNQVQVISGLSPRETFVFRSSSPLKDGMKVRLSALSQSSQEKDN
jgi:hypothetical protein